MPTTEEAPMSEVATQAKEPTKSLHSIDPIMSKKTDLFGRVDVFPPSDDPAQWGILSFLVISEHGVDGEDSRGLKEYIKAKYIHQVFERPHFINDYMRFGHEDRKEYEPEPEKEWNIQPRVEKPKDDRRF
jgi:hypothetical protein